MAPQGHSDIDAYLLGPGQRSEAPGETESQRARTLRFVHVYRLGLAALLTILVATGRLSPQNEALFAWTSGAYLLAAILVLLVCGKRRPATPRIYAELAGDVLAITLLMHASAGVAGGFGMLMIVPIAASSILIAGRASLIVAALASIALLAEQLYAQFGRTEPGPAYQQAGILGLTFFAIALLVHLLAGRIRESEALAARRSLDLANMAELTEHVIHRMQTGILVVDRAGRVRLMNESAWQMFGRPSATHAPVLADLSAGLTERLTRWRNNPALRPAPIRPSPNMADILPRFARIGQDEATLIFLEDSAATAQQAQQLKLASLGRLTASIAHEVRNPLGAISHASQLLEESPSLEPRDRRLAQIIVEQCRRLNTIIENVMQLSRRDRSKPVVVPLQTFLEDVREEWVGIQLLERADLLIDVRPADLRVPFDPSQLAQLLYNLCHNALRHSSHAEPPKIELRAGIGADFQRPYLDVVDHGPGIPPEVAEHIFEPFYTTEATGTGLGLYICRELAESNQAYLSYQPAVGGGSCFRITFQDPRKQIA